MTQATAATVRSPFVDDFDGAAVADDTFVVDVDGFEGPLDLLLRLARDQKVDLTCISILSLAEQYLAFVEAARELRLELAADYLVMAAWLAFLKSRLLLPSEEKDETPSGEELAQTLAHRLRRLEAMRAVGRQLFARPQLGLDVFARGDPEPVSIRVQSSWDASLYDLLAAYAALRLHRIAAGVEIRKRQVFSLKEARERLIRLLGGSSAWGSLDDYLEEFLSVPELRATARASALSASLELVREGLVELRQSTHFAPLYIRNRALDDAMIARAVNG
jgi:segregation and condensation protein A